MTECSMIDCNREIGEDWDFWITLSDYSYKNKGRIQYDIPVCKACFDKLLIEVGE